MPLVDLSNVARPAIRVMTTGFDVGADDVWDYLVGRRGGFVTVERAWPDCVVVPNSGERVSRLTSRARNATEALPERLRGSLP